jgi:archaemetzincin
MNAIHILPLGGASMDLIETIRPPLASAFGAAVETRKADLDLEQFYDGVRTQYNSTRILLRVKELCRAAGTESGAKTLAVVPYDLFIPILTYIFGEAEVGGNAAVVSYYRLAPERYGLPPDRALLEKRFLKEAVHELGHAHALIHCPSQECVMHSSSYVEEIDLKGVRFCPECAATARLRHVRP